MQSQAYRNLVSGSRLPVASMVRATGRDRKRFHLHWVPFEPSLPLVTACHVLRENKARATERNRGMGAWGQVQTL